MAGRKPRQSRDEQAGVTPLTGVPVTGSRVRRKADPKPCIGTIPIGRDGSAGTVTTQVPPGPFGNKINQTHGMDKEQIVTHDQVEPYVRAILDDPKQPDHLRSPQFYGALVSWARFQYMADRAFGRLAGLDFTVMTQPLGKSGQGKSLLELWKLLEDGAAKRRTELGMTPSSYARLRASLGLAHQSEAEAMLKLASAGAEITASRRPAIGPAKPVIAGQVVQDGEPGREIQAAAFGADLARQRAPRRVPDQPPAPGGLYRPSVAQLRQR